MDPPQAVPYLLFLSGRVMYYKFGFPRAAETIAMFSKTLESKLLALEESKGRVLVAFFVSFALLAIAAIYVRPAIATVFLGKWYSALSLDPFSEIPNQIGYRILTPLISYLLGLRGELIIITNLLCALAFLMVSYGYFRKNLEHLADAVYSTAVMAFSLVTLTTIYYGGYCDSLTYLLILLMWIKRANMPLVALLFFLGLLNRESIIFLVPWFAFLYWTESPNKIKSILEILLWYSLAFGLYYLFRLWIASFREVEFTADFYLGTLLTEPLAIFKKSYGNQWLGLFSVFKAFWIIVLIALWSFWKQRQLRNILSLAILAVCMWAQLLIAWDSSRLMTMAFPLMIIALLHVLKENTLGFRGWAMLLLVFNFMVPQLYTAGRIVEQMKSSIGNLFEILFYGKSGW